MNENMTWSELINEISEKIRRKNALLERAIEALEYHGSKSFPNLRDDIKRELES